MFVVLLSLILWIPNPAVAESVDKPKLVLVLVIDQFRADYLTRFESRFLPAKQRDGSVGGFEYLMTKGAYYPQGQHGVLQNMTCPGHAAILSGAYPYQNGIALNDWYDQQKKRDVYCVEDDQFETVGAQIKDPHAGTSPRQMIGTTFGDELKNAGFQSRVVAVALKDRAAILLGGHRADMAMWMDFDDFLWVSSRFYLPDGRLPDWIEKFNRQMRLEKDRPLTWALSGKGSGRSSPVTAVSKDSLHEMQEAEASSKDSVSRWSSMLTTVRSMLAFLPWTQAHTTAPAKSSGSAAILAELRTQFPHAAKAGDEASMFLPFGVEKTVDAAILSLNHYGLGKGRDPDLLAVSFSTHDFLGHFFGPNSREMEELTVVEDGQISRLLRTVDKDVPGGLGNVLIVLTADHGIAANPEWLNEGRQAAGRIDERSIREATEEMLNKKYSRPAEGAWITAVHDLNFYLNHSAIESAGLKLNDVADAVAEFIRHLPQMQSSVAAVFSVADVDRRTLPSLQLETQILRTYRRGRSGDVIVIPNPNFISGRATATHMTGYAYDSTVPIIFAGKWFRSGRFSQPAHVIDIAPTLSYLSGVIPPSGSEGRILTEILK